MVAEPKHSDNPSHTNMKLYAVIAAVLVVIALLSMLLVPRGKGIQYCNSVISQQGRYGCISNLAADTHNASLCGFLNGSAMDQCYVSIAVNSTDPRICNKIVSSNVSSECFYFFANYTRNLTMCGDIKNTALRNSCAYGITLKKGDLSGCGAIDNITESAECYNTIYLDKALETKNISFCSEIGAENSSAQLLNVLQYSNISRYGNLSDEIGQLMQYAAYSNATFGTGDFCYASIAYETSNSAYCSYLKAQNISNACTTFIKYENYATGNFYTGNNDTLNYTKLMNSCQGQVNYQSCVDTYRYLDAITYKNASMCGTIITPSISYNCYFGIAQEYNSTKYCSFITNSTLNSDCVMSIEGLFTNST
jgi:hypothetical protein